MSTPTQTATQVKTKTVSATKFAIAIACFGLFVVLGLPQTASADMIRPGYGVVDWCYEISNADDYPDYLFFLFGYPGAEGVAIQHDKCFDFYKFAAPYIYAVKKTGLKGADLQSKLSATMSDIEQKHYGELVQDESAWPKTREEEFTDSFRNDFGAIIKSNLQLYAFGGVQENDPLQKAVVTIKILSLSENGLDVEKSKVVYAYTDGTSEEKFFQSQDQMPRPSRTANLPWWFAEFWYFILPAVAAVLIGALLLIRRLRK